MLFCRPSSRILFLRTLWCSIALVCLPLSLRQSTTLESRVSAPCPATLLTGAVCYRSSGGRIREPNHLLCSIRIEHDRIYASQFYNTFLARDVRPMWDYYRRVIFSPMAVNSQWSAKSAEPYGANIISAIAMLSQHHQQGLASWGKLWQEAKASGCTSSAKKTCAKGYQGWTRHRTDSISPGHIRDQAFEA